MSCDVATTNSLPTYFKTEVTEINDSELNKDDSMEVLDDCDASTVVNISLRKKDEKEIVIKDHAFESDVVDNSLSSCDVTLLNEEFNHVPTTDHSKNVVSIILCEEVLQFILRHISYVVLIDHLA
jgi:hypothetical protein